MILVFDRSLHLLVFWILFENVMSLHRTKATFVGLLEASRVNEWVVTEKLGDANKLKPAMKAIKRVRFKFGERYISSLHQFKFITLPRILTIVCIDRTKLLTLKKNCL